MKKVLFLLSFVAIALIAISCSGEVKTEETTIDALTTKDFYLITKEVIHDDLGPVNVVLPRFNGELVIEGTKTATPTDCWTFTGSVGEGTKALNKNDNVVMTWDLESGTVKSVKSILVNDEPQDDALLAMNRLISLATDSLELMEPGTDLLFDLMESLNSPTSASDIAITNSFLKINDHTVTVSSSLKPAWIIEDITSPTETATYTDYDALRVFSLGFECGASLDLVTVLDNTSATDKIYFDRYGEMPIKGSFWTVSSVGTGSIEDAIKFIEDVLNVKLTVCGPNDSGLIANLLSMKITGIEVSAMDLALELSIANTAKNRNSVIKFNISNSNLINIFQAPIYKGFVQADSLKLDTTLSVSGSWVLNGKKCLSIDDLTLTINSDNCDESLRFRDEMSIDEVYNKAIRDNFDKNSFSKEFDEFKTFLGISNFSGKISLNGVTYSVQEIYNALTCL